MSGYKNSITDINGKVGIGTASPSDKLSVYTTTDYGNNSEYANATIGLGNASYPVSIRSYRYSGSYLNGLDFYYNNGTPQLGMRIDSSGDVSISGGLLELGGEGISAGYIVSQETLYFNTDTNNNGDGLIVFGQGRTRNTGGSEFMRITSSGNVGIGTDSPDHILCIEDTEPTFRIFDTANTLNQEQTISFGTEPGNRTHAEISGINTNTGNAEGGLIFKTNSGASLTERMRINQSGNVGIGVSPSGSKLHILSTNQTTTFESSTTGLFNTYANSNGIFAYVGTGSQTVLGTGANDFGIQVTNNFVISTGGYNEKMRITSAGNVGIGTDSPSAKLEVTVADSSSILKLTRTGSASFSTLISDIGEGAAQLWFNADTDDTGFVFRPKDSSGNPSNAFFIAPSGSIGIGTDSPTARLMVKDSSDSGFNSGIGIVRSANTQTGYINMVGGAMNFNSPSIPFTFRQSGSEIMRITSGGNVGIDVSNPQERLDVGGVMRAFGYESRSGTNGITQYTGDFFNIFWTGSSAQLYIDTASVGTITLTSDYRVKKNIETQNASAIERINALRPVKYEYADYENIFVADNIQREGFIAHEVAQIIPSAVEGEKDAENAFQSLKLDAMLSVAVKAIQEQQEIINDLKARIETLENQ